MLSRDRWRTASAVAAGFVLGAAVVGGAWWLFATSGGPTEREREQWIAGGRAGGEWADDPAWSDCGVAYDPTRTRQLVICAREGNYVCFDAMGTPDKPNRWRRLTAFGSACSAAEAVLVDEGVINPRAARQR